jgi:hypothetical protein
VPCGCCLSIHLQVLLGRFVGFPALPPDGNKRPYVAVPRRPHVRTLCSNLHRSGTAFFHMHFIGVLVPVRCVRRRIPGAHGSCLHSCAFRKPATARRDTPHCTERAVHSCPRALALIQWFLAMVAPPRMGCRSTWPCPTPPPPPPEVPANL